MRAAAGSSGAAPMPPPPAPIAEDEEALEEEEARDSATELPGTRPVRATRSARDWTPLKADDCFAAALEVSIAAGSGTAAVRAYYTPPRQQGSDGTVFVLHHGAGFGGLAFALMAREVTRLSNGEVGLLAYDCRGHGRSAFPDDAARDLSRERLVDDLVALVTTMFPDRAARPSLVLAGHSMGGAVVVAAAHRIMREQLFPVTGVAMLDIVEGTSLQVLPEMLRIVQQRPAEFASVEEAIEWHVASRTIRNPESARRSVPALVRRTRDGRAYRWNADLVGSEPYWSGWFTGLSNDFLAVRAARLLILAETENLDRPLMIGQMQGKYQLVVSREAGHCVQEDQPHETAQALRHLWGRNEKSVPPGLKKVGQR
mgnify:FL=1